MGKIKKLTEELQKYTESQSEDLKEIAIENFKKYDIDISFDDVKEHKLKTAYDIYTFYGDYAYGVIKGEDFRKFVSDICKEVGACLPDYFDVYFNSEKLEKDIWAGWGNLLHEAQTFIADQKDEIPDLIEKFEPADDDCYIITIL